MKRRVRVKEDISKKIDEIKKKYPSHYRGRGQVVEVAIFNFYKQLENEAGLNDSTG